MDFVKDQNSKSVIEFKILFHFKQIKNCRCFFLFVFARYFPNFTMQIVDNILITLDKGQFLKFCLNAKPKSHIINGKYICIWKTYLHKIIYLCRTYSIFKVALDYDLNSFFSSNLGSSLKKGYFSFIDLKINTFRLILVPEFT